MPFADNSVYQVSDELSDEQVLSLADILPTAFEVGVLNGMVSPGDVVAIVGAGPIGLAAILTARLYTPGLIVAIDLADSRLQSARLFGADITINTSPEKLWIRDVMITTGLVDTFSIPQLLRLIASGRLDPSLLATHRFGLDDTMAAYDTFADAANSNALKVVLQGADSQAPRTENARAVVVH